jgi:hypothetical protein
VTGGRSERWLFPYCKIPKPAFTLVTHMRQLLLNQERGNLAIRVAESYGPQQCSNISQPGDGLD